MVTHQFVIDEQYFIAHMLASIDSAQFSSERRAEVVAVQNAAWRLSQRLYNTITGRLVPFGFSDHKLARLSVDLQAFFASIKSTPEYYKALTRLHDYRNWCRTEWNRKQRATTAIVADLLGLTLDRPFTIFLTHPDLRNGQYLGSNRIAYGHSEEWPNYTVVYLWHEMLHAYLPANDINHCIIQFVCDNELRYRLGRGQYLPLEGHDYLAPLMNAGLPVWREYVRSKPRRLTQLQSRLGTLKKRLRSPIASKLCTDALCHRERANETWS